MLPAVRQKREQEAALNQDQSLHKDFLHVFVHKHIKHPHIYKSHGFLFLSQNICIEFFPISLYTAEKVFDPCIPKTKTSCSHVVTDIRSLTVRLNLNS